MDLIQSPVSNFFNPHIPTISNQITNDPKIHFAWNDTRFLVQFPDAMLTLQSNLALFSMQYVPITCFSE